MEDKLKQDPCCAAISCCKVESLVTADERGQMILPKELRERAGIKPGDKLAVVSWDKGGGICCISLVRAGDLSALVKEFLGPVVSGIWK
ncbi:MAG: HgcAB-associated protein HgcC [Bacillota bacterium]